MVDRELDELVLKEVFGGSFSHAWVETCCGSQCDYCGSNSCQDSSEACEPWFSSNLPAAWKVAEKVNAELCDFSLEKSGLNWTASWPGFRATTNSPSRAICLAAVEFYKAKR